MSYFQLFRHISIISLLLLSGCTLIHPNTQQEVAKSAIEDLAKQQTASNNAMITALENLLASHEASNEELEKQIASLAEEVRQITGSANPKAESDKKQYQEKPEDSPVRINSSKVTVGATEWLRINNIEQDYLARVDTGAAISSLNASGLVIYERDGSKWVRFNIDDGEGPAPNANTTAGYQLDLPITRFVRIRKAGINDSERRPVVELSVSLGPITQLSDFTLTDREQMNFPALLGRSFLKDLMIVDISNNTVHGKTNSSDSLSAENEEQW